MPTASNPINYLLFANTDISGFIAFRCIALCQDCIIYKLKVYGNSVLRKAVGAIFSQQHLFTSCLCVTFW